jgi:hypothetical protein
MSWSIQCGSVVLTYYPTPTTLLRAFEDSMADLDTRFLFGVVGLRRFDSEILIARLLELRFYFQPQYTANQHEKTKATLANTLSRFNGNVKMVQGDIGRIYPSATSIMELQSTLTVVSFAEQSSRSVQLFVSK